MVERQCQRAGQWISTPNPRPDNRRSALAILASASAGFLSASANSHVSADSADSSPATVEPSTPPLVPLSIGLVDSWSVGSAPNYCGAGVVDWWPIIWIAAYESGVVTRVDVRSDQTTPLPACKGILPLDAAYDRMRRRIAVASAVGEATMVVLSEHGQIVARRELAQLTSQGPSGGIAQGVIVYRIGNYWFALACYHAGVSGLWAIVKIDGNTFDPVFVI